MFRILTFHYVRVMDNVLTLCDFGAIGRYCKRYNAAIKRSGHTRLHVFNPNSTNPPNAKFADPSNLTATKFTCYTVVGFFEVFKFRRFDRFVKFKSSKN